MEPFSKFNRRITPSPIPPRPNVNMSPKTSSNPKMDLVKGSWLKDGVASISNIKRYFRRPEVREDLRIRLGLPKGNVAQLDEHIKQIMEMIPNKLRPSTIGPEDFGRKFKEEESWGPRRDITKKAEGGFTVPELKDIKRQGVMREYIKEKFGGSK